MINKQVSYHKLIDMKLIGYSLQNIVSLPPRKLYQLIIEYFIFIIRNIHPSIYANNLATAEYIKFNKNVIRTELNFIIDTIYLIYDFIDSLQWCCLIFLHILLHVKFFRVTERVRFYATCIRVSVPES